MGIGKEAVSELPNVETNFGRKKNFWDFNSTSLKIFPPQKLTSYNQVKFC